MTTKQMLERENLVEAVKMALGGITNADKVANVAVDAVMEYQQRQARMKAASDR